ncbi:MAG TPA: hypothetical protein VGQ83_28450 [Polyangia bacterium]|jgi:hypothetical protein
MAMRDPAERLRAQLERLRGDERLRQRAALAGEMTPQELLAETWALCRWAAFFLDQLPEDEAARARGYHEALPADAGPVLRRLARLAAPAAEPP